ncbi:MAG TPA: murein biosynthesis integral membrane protein MurJ [Caulobacteraceae bacterium]|nr:murein biosynthesis integral membrane protein MurJ [Caulobacteraceae bacterium]
MSVTTKPPEAPLPKVTAPSHSTRRAAGVVGLAVIGSRLFGLVREVVFAAMFGAGKLLDVYIAAFRIPNLLRDLFAEGALSLAFTTLFTRTWETEGEKPAWELANLILTAMIFLMGLVCVAAIAGAPAIVEVTNFGFHNVPGKFDLAVRLTRILFPFILFVSLAAAVMGMLNARFVFGVPASASTVFNIVSVVAGVGLAFAFEPGALANWRHPVFDERALYGVSAGVLLGGLCQLGMQLPSLFAQGFRFRWRLNLRDPRLAELWRLMWPSLIAAATVQVNVLINGMFASEINGGQSWLYCAFRLMQLPIGVFGVSLGTATLPAVTRAAARGDMDAFGHTVRDSLRLAAFLTLPAAAGLAALADPIIAVIYQHGRFSAHDTHQTAMALQAYAVGLSGYAAILVLRPCFYALNLPKIPMRVSLIGIAICLILNLFNMLVLKLGHVGLALSTSAVAIINMGQLFFALRKRVDLGAGAPWIGFLARCLLAAGVCAGLAMGASWEAAHLGMPRIVGLGAGVALGVGGYFAAARVLGLSESHEAWLMIRRRIPFLPKPA